MSVQQPVVLVPWSPSWASEFSDLAAVLTSALGSTARWVDHIGSTAVPGLVAKDVIDIQVVVSHLDPDAIAQALGPSGFVVASEQWNRRDHIPAGWSGDARQWDKLVFRPRPELRTSNVHVRVSGSPNERYALLFRDYLRADEAAARRWGRFKTALGAACGTLSEYGSVKDPATDILMESAESWAASRAWTPR
jgi:GrpB-like predicted nucleotidyltransferase (UPF0157 family)